MFDWFVFQKSSTDSTSAQHEKSFSLASHHPLLSWVSGSLSISSANHQIFRVYSNHTNIIEMSQRRYSNVTLLNPIYSKWYDMTNETINNMKPSCTSRSLCRNSCAEGFHNKQTFITFLFIGIYALLISQKTHLRHTHSHSTMVWKKFHFLFEILRMENINNWY